jgi:hypothetical protein
MQIKNMLNGSVRRISRLYRVIVVSLLCIVLLTSSGLSNTKASDDQMAINLHVEPGNMSFHLNWDNVYPDYWYIPEVELSDGEFYPLVDIPIKESEFEYKIAPHHCCFRIKVVDKKYKTIAVSKYIVCSHADCENLSPLNSVENDGDCNCLLMMCYQTGCRNAFIVMAEEEYFEEKLEDPPVDRKGNIFENSCRGKLSWNPIIQDNRVYIKPRDILDFIPGARVEWDQENKSLEMYIPRVIYAYGDDTEPVHFTKVELWLGESIALVDGDGRNIDKSNHRVKPFIKKKMKMELVISWCLYVSLPRWQVQETLFGFQNTTCQS